MSIKRTFNGATIIKPGAYSKIVVENLTGFPLQPTGVVGIIGEALGGEPRVLDILIGPNIQSAKTRYKSGPIADALDLLVNGSKDPRIPNGASTVIVYKTNNGTQSAVNLPNKSAANKVLLTSKNYGSDENHDQVSVTVGSVVDQDATIKGSIAGPFNLAGGETLKLKIDDILYTYTNTLVGAAVTPAALVADINTSGHWAPSKPVIASLDAITPTLIDITLDSTALPAAALDYGYIWVDPTSTIETIIGIVGSARGKKGSRFLTFTKDTKVETSLELGGVDVMSLLYTGTGTAALASIQVASGVMSLTTAITGAAGDNLNIALSDASGNSLLTLKQLVAAINATGKYTAVVLYPNSGLAVTDLDYYVNLDITKVPAVLRRDDADMVDYVTTFSAIASASRVVNVAGSVATTSNPLSFAGGTDGTSLNSDFANGFLAFQQERIETVVPLISVDQGPLSVDSINALAANHASWGWSTLGRSERNAFVSKKCSKAALKLAASQLNSGYVSIVGQSPTVLDKTGTLVEKDPWALACILASMRAGAEVGEPLTFKYINVNALTVDDLSWSPKNDYQEMLDAGVTICEGVDGGGFRVVLGNTTYGIDPSFVWNRESVVEAAGYVAYDLRYNLELVFTGTKARTGSAEAVANFIKARMSTYLAADIIVGDDDNKGLGYRNLGVQIQGNTALINVSITPVQGIDFILPTIYLADIVQSA